MNNCSNSKSIRRFSHSPLILGMKNQESELEPKPLTEKSFN